MGKNHSIAQTTYVPLGNPAYHTIDRLEIKSGQMDDNLFTTTKPYTRSQTVWSTELADDLPIQFRRLDRYAQSYIYKDSNEWSDFGLIKSKRPVFKKLYEYQSDLIRFKYYDELLLKISPVFYWEIGKQPNSDGLRFVNAKGATLRGSVAESVGFNVTITDTQAGYPDYIYDRIAQSGAVPYQGRYKLYESSVANNLAAGVDFLTATGYITFKPIEQIRFQLGHDKNFLGDGMRSLFLSDFSNNYFFLKINTKVWKLNYQNIFAELTEQHAPGADTLLNKKYMATHHLSWNVTKWLNIGLFESVIFDRTKGFELQYLNPLILYRAVEYQLGSPDNVLLGLNYKVNFLKRFSLYGQVALDEFKFSEITNRNGWWGNKYAWQMGLKYINIANIANLDAQIEYNAARPYMYSHNNTSANYTHYNQPLAHPLGANFREVVGKVQYQPHHRIQIVWQTMFAKQGVDSTNTNYGSNIFLNNTWAAVNRPYGNSILQGKLQQTFLNELVVSYMPKHNLFFDVSFLRRKQNGNAQNYIGITARLNMYRNAYLF